MDEFAVENAQIRQMQADIVLKTMDAYKRHQDIRYAPVTLIFTGMGAGAALFGAAIAFLQWIR